MKLVTIEAEAFQGFPEKETSLASKQSKKASAILKLNFTRTYQQILQIKQRKPK